MTLAALISGLLRHAPDCTAEEIADAFWLAAHAPATAGDGGSDKSGGDEKGEPRPDPRHPDIDPAKQTKPASKNLTSSRPHPVESLQKNPFRDTTKDNEDVASGGEAGLHTHSGSSPLPSGAVSLRVPGGRALPERLALARALRPFSRRVASRIRSELDETATAHHIAESGIWEPILVPARARWLEIALVLDTHASMAVWQPTLLELRRLLETLGTFRDVRLWTLDTSAPARLPVLRSAHASSPRNRKELISADGRRLVLLASDCLGPAWRDGSVATWLQPLAARQPLVLWQLLPERLWRHTHLRHAHFAHVTTTESACPNARLQAELWRARPGAAPSENTVRLPVVNAEPHRLAAWARFVAGAPRLRLPAILLPLPNTPSPLDPSAPAPPPAPAPAPPAPNAETRVRAFRQTATPEAFRLSCFLSASVLRFPIMRLVQSVMLPEASQTTLAEVYLGGLLVQISSVVPDAPADEVDYDFHAGVRDLLLKFLSTPDLLETHARVSEYLQHHLGHRLDFRAIIADPSLRPPRPEDTNGRRFASVTAAVLRRLGGKHARLADHLDNQRRLPPPQAARFDGIRILWVDDKPAGNRRFHERLPGAEIVEAKSTLEAMLFLTDKQMHFNAVISDLGRPESKHAGLDLLSELRERGNPVPFGIFSRFVRAPATENAFRLGAFACTASFQRLALRLSRQIGTDDRYALPKHIHKAVSETLARLDLPHHLSQVLARDPGSEAWQVFWDLIAKDPVFARVSTLLATVADCDTLKVWSHRMGEADFVAAIPSHADTVSEAKPGNLVIETARKMRTRLLKKGGDFAHECALVPAINRFGSAPLADGVLELHFKTRDAFSAIQRAWLNTFLERLPPIGRRLLFTPPDEKPLAWVLIAGAEKWPRNPDLAVWSEEVGTALADARFGLVCGGWPGVDEAVTAAYLKVLERRTANPARFIRQIVEPGRKPRIEKLETIHMRSIVESIRRSIEAADAVVMIGGAGGTARVGREALEAGLPVLPLPHTGGDALKLYIQLDKERQRGKSRVGASIDALDTPLEKLRHPLIDLIRDGQRFSKAKERIERLKDALIEALHSHDHEHLHNALNDTDPGHYGVDEVEFSVAHENLDLDRALRSFTFRGARISFTARLGSSREEDSIELPSAKEISGSGSYEPGPKNKVSVTAFKINERIDLYDGDDHRDGNDAGAV